MHRHSGHQANGLRPKRNGLQPKRVYTVQSPDLVEGEGFEPSKAEPSDLQSDPFDRSGTPPNETANFECLRLISQCPFQGFLRILRCGSRTSPHIEANRNAV